MAPLPLAQYASWSSNPCLSLTPVLSLELKTGVRVPIGTDWANEDVVALIKRQLQLVLPGAKVFLDKDDLKDLKHLERYVEQSQTMLLLLGTPGYFGSKNCERELSTARRLELPLVLVHDGNDKTGAPLAKLQEACVASLDEGARAFIFGSGANEREIVPWHRAPAFQLASLLRIAEHVLRATPSFDRAYNFGSESLLSLPGGEEQLSLASPVVLFVSAANKGAANIANELKQRVANLTLDTWRAADQPPLKVKGSPGDLSQSLLLYLNKDTFVSDGDTLCDHVKAARAAGTPVLLVHETDAAKGGVKFETFFTSTPTSLVDDGLYETIAIEWHGREPYKSVSLRLITRELGACVNEAGGFGRVCARALQLAARCVCVRALPMGSHVEGGEGGDEGSAVEMQEGRSSYRTASGLIIERSESMSRVATGTGTGDEPDDTESAALTSAHGGGGWGRLRSQLGVWWRVEQWAQRHQQAPATAQAGHGMPMSRVTEAVGAGTFRRNIKRAGSMSQEAKWQQHDHESL